jgi:hypothetical protein
VYNNNLDFKEYARTATHDSHNNYDAPFSAVGIMVGGSINFVADGNSVKQGVTGLYFGSGWPEAQTDLHTLATPNYWFTAVNNEFGASGGNEVTNGVEIMHSGPSAGVPTLGVAIRNNVVVAADVVRDVGRPETSAGFVTHGYEGFNLNSTANSGPNYLAFEGNDVTATQGYLHDPLWISGHGSSGGEDGAGYVAEGIPEDLVFYRNIFDSGASSTAVKMNYNLYTDFDDLISRYPLAYRPMHNNTLDPAAAPVVPADFQFHVLKDNVFRAMGSTYSPVHDFGFDSGHPDYDAGLVTAHSNEMTAPLRTLHLALKVGETRTGLLTQIWGSDLANIDIDTVVSSSGWLTVGSHQYNSLDNAWDIPFSASAASLAAGQYTAVITATNDVTGLEIELRVFLDVL